MVRQTLMSVAASHQKFPGATQARQRPQTASTERARSEIDSSTSMTEVLKWGGKALCGITQARHSFSSSGLHIAQQEPSALHYSADLDSCGAIPQDLAVARAPPVMRHIIRGPLEPAGLNLWSQQASATQGYNVLSNCCERCALRT